MDTKITLHFNKDVIEKAKKLASANNVSLSQLTEFLYRQITTRNYKTLEVFPVTDGGNQIADGEAIYKKRNRKDTKNEFFINTKQL